MSDDKFSLNVLLDVIEEIADSHKMVADFSIGDAATRGHDKGQREETGGQEEEPEEMKYPYVWADPVTTGYQIGQARSIAAKTYSVSIFVADKHSDDAENDTEILSDTEGILSDIIQYIATHPTLKKFGLPVGVISANVARHTTIHEAYGWEAVLAVQVPYKFCYNRLPIN